MNKNKNKILIVDDDEAIINMEKLAFSRAGYDVVSAESGEQALKILQQENIHVIFTDLNMPDMNGIELCMEIRRLLPIAVVFAVTGFASLFELAECREAGFEDYFVKPVNLKKLVKTAENAFEKLNRWKTS